MEITHHRPSLTDFISVDVYERSTPDSFFDGPSVLYYHAKTVSLIVSKDDFDETAALQKLKPPSQAEAPSDPEAELTLPDLEIWASLAWITLAPFHSSWLTTGHTERYSSTRRQPAPASQYRTLASEFMPSRPYKARYLF